MTVTEISGAVCAECGGSGWITVDQAGERVRPCGCRRRRDAGRLLAAAQIPERYERCRLEGFKLQSSSPAGEAQLKQAHGVCSRYVDAFCDDGRFTDGGLIFTGPPGAGKTHLAVAVLRELIERYRVRGRFVDFTSLTQELHAAIDRASGISTTSLIEPLERAELLVLDELGSQKLNSWTSDVLYNLINSRYRHRRPTLFTTNYRLEEAAPRGVGDDQAPDPARFGALGFRIPAMLVSRLFEMAQPVVLDQVGDYRRDINAHSLDF